MRSKAVLAATAAVFLMGAASDPSERLPDPAAEARARELFAEIRCVVCQNESIDDSEADLAGDLRRVVREQVAAGRSDAQVRGFLTDRYGDFVLMKPRFSAANLPLWLLPFAIVLVGLALLFARRRRAPAAAEPLSEAEEAQLAAIVNTPGASAP